MKRQRAVMALPEGQAKRSRNCEQCEARDGAGGRASLSEPAQDPLFFLFVGERSVGREQGHFAGQYAGQGTWGEAFRGAGGVRSPWRAFPLCSTSCSLFSIVATRCSPVPDSSAARDFRARILRSMSKACLFSAARRAMRPALGHSEDPSGSHTLSLCCTNRLGWAVSETYRAP